MYHVNPAVTKSLLMKLDAKAFIREAIFIKEQAINLPPGSNERFKFLNLYVWCQKYYIQYHKKHPSSMEPNHTPKS